MGKDIKVGQRWVTRDGRILLIEEVDRYNSDNGPYPVWAIEEDKSNGYSYTLNGEYYADGQEATDDDLMYEYVEEPEEESKEEIVKSTTPPPSVFEVGQKWKTRNGSVATISSVSLDMDLNYPVMALVETGSFPRTLSYTTDGFYFSNDYHSHDPMDLLELILEDGLQEGFGGDPMEVLVDLVTQLYEETVKEEPEAVEEDDFVNQEHLWTHLLSGGLVQSKDNKQVFGFDNGYVRVFTEKDKAEPFISTLNFTLMNWAKYTFPEKEVWKPRKSTLCWVTDSETANHAYSYDVEFICDYEDGLYINTDEGRTWKYATPLTMAEVASYLDECE